MRVLFCSDVESAPFWIFLAAVHFSTYTLREALQKEEHKWKGCIAPFGVRLRGPGLVRRTVRKRVEGLTSASGEQERWLVC